MLSRAERAQLEAISRLAYCNPFLPDRVAGEREVLGADFVEGEPVWSYRADRPGPRENVWRVYARLEPLAESIRVRLSSESEPSNEDLALYEDCVLHLLYTRYYPSFFEGPKDGRWKFYASFLADWRHFFHIEGKRFSTGHDPRHTFACFRQIQRAFDAVFRDIIGSSLPAARLRASVWQSIFTHDMRRYRRTLYARMGEFATLITGPSGTGKELAARAIAQSRYLPFDDQRLTFPNDNAAAFFPINISALSPTLVESELFGHRRGSFTGAIADRKGWLETCPESGSVFLDELGELDPAIQVKLLRVIETRSFHPVGEISASRFRGKLITATNRDLAAMIAKGAFREDLYYRLCSDQVVTPSLAEQLADSPGVLRELVEYMSARVAGAEAEDLAEEVMRWIESSLGDHYAWPGNYRELEQCVKNVLIRRNYRPIHESSGDALEEFAESARTARLGAEDMLRQYVTIAYARAGTYEETARRLGLDRRTVKAKIDQSFLKRLVGQAILPAAGFPAGAPPERRRQPG